MAKIISLEELKSWNLNPTEENPIVLEWFMDWFFEYCLMKNKHKLSLDAYNTMIEFTRICEKMSFIESKYRVNGNFNYYSGYSSKWGEKWLKFQLKNKLQW